MNRRISTLETMPTEAVILAVLIVAFLALYFGVPYLQTRQRRKALEHKLREQEKQRPSDKDAV